MFMRTVGPTSFLTRRRWAYEDLVYGINYSPELTGIGKYTGEMVAWMAQEGHEVRVITAPPYYPQWKVGERYSAALSPGRGAGYRLALPAVCAETALHPKTTTSSGELCIEQFSH